MINIKNYNELTARVKAVITELQAAVGGAITALTGVTLTGCTIIGGTSTALAVVRTYATAGALTLQEGVHVITGTAATALTVAAPTSPQNGTIITVMSASAYAHTLTFTGGTFVNGGATALTTATFAAHVGATLRFIAYNGQWYQSGVSNVTLA